jgi:phosphonate transport system substrate-binding protein
MFRVSIFKSVLQIAVAAFLYLLSFSEPASASAQTYPLSFGIVPQQSATRLARDWVPFLAKVSKLSGVSLRFATVTDIPTFEGCLGEGAFDFAYMNPYHFTVFNRLAGYHAFARQADKRLRGLIVVAKNSPIKTLKDLDGLGAAFPSPAAFGASAIQRAELKQLGIRITPAYVNSHDSVYRAVEAGLYVAGGGVTRTFASAPSEIRNKLRILHQTKAYTPHAFAARADVPAEAVARVRNTMLALAADDPVLLPLGITGFQAATDRDWDDVRRLELTPNDTGIRLRGTAPCPSG